MRLLMFLLFQGLQRLTNAEQFLAFLLVILSFLQIQFALGRKDGALDVTKFTDDLALELFKLGF